MAKINQPRSVTEDTEQSADEYARTHGLKTLNGLRPAFQGKSPAQIQAMFNKVGLQYLENTGEVVTLKDNKPVNVSIFHQD